MVSDSHKKSPSEITAAGIATAPTADSSAAPKKSKRSLFTPTASSAAKKRSDAEDKDSLHSRAGSLGEAGGSGNFSSHLPPTFKAGSWGGSRKSAPSTSPPPNKKKSLFGGSSHRSASPSPASKLEGKPPLRRSKALDSDSNREGSPIERSSDSLSQKAHGRKASTGSVDLERKSGGSIKSGSVDFSSDTGYHDFVKEHKRLSIFGTPRGIPRAKSESLQNSASESDVSKPKHKGHSFSFGGLGRKASLNSLDSEKGEAEGEKRSKKSKKEKKKEKELDSVTGEKPKKSKKNILSKASSKVIKAFKKADKKGSKNALLVGASVKTKQPQKPGADLATEDSIDVSGKKQTSDLESMLSLERSASENQSFSQAATDTVYLAASESVNTSLAESEYADATESIDSDDIEDSEEGQEDGEEVVEIKEEEEEEEDEGEEVLVEIKKEVEEEEEEEVKEEELEVKVVSRQLNMGQLLNVKAADIEDPVSKPAITAPPHLEIHTNIEASPFAGTEAQDENTNARGAPGDGALTEPIEEFHEDADDYMPRASIDILDSPQVNALVRAEIEESFISPLYNNRSIPEVNEAEVEKDEENNLKSTESPKTAEDDSFLVFINEAKADDSEISPEKLNKEELMESEGGEIAVVSIKNVDESLPSDGVATADTLPTLLSWEMTPDVLEPLMSRISGSMMSDLAESETTVIVKSERSEQPDFMKAEVMGPQELFEEEEASYQASEHSDIPESLEGQVSDFEDQGKLSAYSQRSYTPSEDAAVTGNIDQLVRNDSNISQKSEGSFVSNLTIENSEMVNINKEDKEPNSLDDQEFQIEEVAQKLLDKEAITEISVSLKSAAAESLEGSNVSFISLENACDISIAKSDKESVHVATDDLETLGIKDVGVPEELRDDISNLSIEFEKSEVQHHITDQSKFEFSLDTAMAADQDVGFDIVDKEKTISFLSTKKGDDEEVGDIRGNNDAKETVAKVFSYMDTSNKETAKPFVTEEKEFVLSDDKSVNKFGEDFGLNENDEIKNEEEVRENKQKNKEIEDGPNEGGFKTESHKISSRDIALENLTVTREFPDTISNTRRNSKSIPRSMPNDMVVASEVAAREVEDLSAQKGNLMSIQTGSRSRRISMASATSRHERVSIDDFVVPGSPTKSVVSQAKNDIEMEDIVSNCERINEMPEFSMTNRSLPVSDLPNNDAEKELPVTDTWLQDAYKAIASEASLGRLMNPSPVPPATEVLANPSYAASERGSVKSATQSVIEELKKQSASVLKKSKKNKNNKKNNSSNGMSLTRVLLFVTGFTVTTLWALIMRKPPAFRALDP